MNKITRWWWVRHAPVINEHHIISGQMDLECNISAISQSFISRVIDFLPQNALCFTSDSKQAKQTASHLHKNGLIYDNIVEDIDFRDQNFGDWQGLPYDKFTTLRDQMAHRYSLSPATERPPHGESFLDVIARVSPAITKYSSTIQSEDIIVVTHAPPIRAAIAFATGLSPDQALHFNIKNLSVTCLEFIQNDDINHWRVGFINWHLPV